MEGPLYDNLARPTIVHPPEPERGAARLPDNNGTVNSQPNSRNARTIKA